MEEYLQPKTRPNLGDADYVSEINQLVGPVDEKQRKLVKKLKEETEKRAKRPKVKLDSFGFVEKKTVVSKRPTDIDSDTTYSWESYN